MSIQLSDRALFVIKYSVGLIAVLVIIFAGWLYTATRGPVGGSPIEQLVIPTGMSERAALDKIEASGYVKNIWLFEKWWDYKNPAHLIKAGGYSISKSLSIFRLTDVLLGRPLSLWVTIPEGLRKEEIAQIFQDKLHWNDAEVVGFLSAYRDFGAEYVEGVYFPETYLVPINDSGGKVAKRMIGKFNEHLSTLAPALAKENIKWSTMLKLASLVQREAASRDDMPLIAGILWNRLEKKQRLEIDATIQYVKSSISGTEAPPAGGWWPVLKSGDTGLDSPYNTYRNKGLPPTAITNPGKDALDAAVHPTTTTCLFYIHDHDKNIHCAVTFDEHRANIAKYLK